MPLPDDVVLDGFDEIPEGDEEAILPSEVLQEDAFFKLTANTLELKTYFFPMRKSKFIAVSSIKTIYHKPQECSDMLRTKLWGMCGCNTWWASDIKRGFRGSNPDDDKAVFHNVVVDCGEKLLKGFTVSNYTEFVEIILSLRPSGIEIVEKLPDLI